MDEEIERLFVSVRADTGGFARDLSQMRAELEGSLGDGAERAGRRIETALVRAVRTGRIGFDDLRDAALGTLAEIASAAIRAGVGSLGGMASGASGAGTGVPAGFGMPALGVLIGALSGLPGRATGGPVAPGRGYLVGERGPELFVPTASGRVETMAPVTGVQPARDVRVAITVNAGAGEAPKALERSGRQVARAVRAALERAG